MELACTWLWYLILASSCRGESKWQPATHVRRAAGPTRMHAWLGAASLDRGSEPPGGRPGRSMEQGRSRKLAWERSSRTRPRGARRPSWPGGSRPRADQAEAGLGAAGAGCGSRKSAQCAVLLFSSFLHIFCVVAYFLDPRTPARSLARRLCHTGGHPPDSDPSSIGAVCGESR
jgi:hypothetical protein